MTYSVLGTSVLTVLSRRSIRRRQVASDMVAYAIYLSIQHYLPEAREVWAFCFALGYTTWSLLPGSFTSLDLPSHSAFMKGLGKQDKQAEYMVCWDKHTLAQLPCGHGLCERCLQLMGRHCQTACPMCRNPLFEVMDWSVLAAMKSAIISLTITIPLCLLSALHEGSRKHHRNVAV